MNFPSISILIAARNEEQNILRCLESIHHLNYPKERLQILIGNDDSTDNTKQITLKYIEDKPHFQLITIQEKVENLTGKANVLAQLAREARGEYYFFTDADIAVPPTWIEAILAEFSEKVGVVTGITTMESKNIFHELQGIEWLSSLYVMFWFAKLNVPLTGMGNNMAITREAYWQTGGYEKIGFSVTEDYDLFRAILAADYEFKQAYCAEVLTISKPMNTWSELMQQRKRWMYGAMRLPFSIQINTWSNALFLPVLIMLAFVFPYVAWIDGISYYLLCFFTAYMALKKAKQPINSSLLIFPIYFGIIYFVMFVNYFLPTKTVWKGRQY